MFYELKNVFAGCMKCNVCNVIRIKMIYLCLHLWGPLSLLYTGYQGVFPWR